MKEIKDAQKKWKAAKDAAQTRSENAHDYEYARKLGACQMFTGEESMEEMIKLMFSPQGAEFLTANNFPDIASQYADFLATLDISFEIDAPDLGWDARAAEKFIVSLKSSSVSASPLSHKAL